MRRAPEFDPLAAEVPPQVVRIPRPRPAQPAAPVLYVCECGDARGAAGDQSAATLAVKLHRASTGCTARARLIGRVGGWQ